MAPCFSLQPSFPITTGNISLLSHERHAASDRKHSSYRGELCGQAPVWGSLAVRSCPRGAWNQQNSSKGKGCRRHHSPVITGETFQGLHYSHALHPPGEFVSFQCEKKVNANLCKLYSNPAHLERRGDRLIQDRKDLLGFSPLTWKQ